MRAAAERHENVRQRRGADAVYDAVPILFTKCQNLYAAGAPALASAPPESADLFTVTHNYFGAL